MATASGHIQVTTTKENENYARLSRAIVDLMTFILREILTLYILPADIERKALLSSKLNNLRAEQWNLINQAKTNGYTDFDITLLYTLLRNLCTSVPKPTAKWGRIDLPKSHEVTLGDDIERIRIVKNRLQSHLPTTILNDAEFEDYWKILRDVCVRLDSQFNKKYTDDLDNLKAMCLDSTLQTEYSDNLKLLKDREIENSSEIKENTRKIKENTSQIKDNTSQIKEHISQIKKHTSQIKEHTGQLKVNTSRIQENTSQIKDHASQIKDHASQFKDHVSQFKDHASQLKDNASQLKDHASQIKDHACQIQGMNP